MTITNNGDYVLCGVGLLLNLANQNNIDIKRHNNMSHTDLNLPLTRVSLQYNNKRMKKYRLDVVRNNIKNEYSIVGL